MMGGDVEQVELTERVAGGEGEGEAASAGATAASAEATEGAAAGGGGAAEQPHADGAATPVLTRVGRSVLSWLEYAGDHLADVFGLNDSKVREARERMRAPPDARRLRREAARDWCLQRACNCVRFECGPAPTHARWPRHPIPVATAAPATTATAPPSHHSQHRPTHRTHFYSTSGPSTSTSSASAARPSGARCAPRAAPHARLPRRTAWRAVERRTSLARARLLSLRGETVPWRWTCKRKAAKAACRSARCERPSVGAHVPPTRVPCSPFWRTRQHPSRM